jgi:N-acetylneuraminate lyase
MSIRLNGILPALVTPLQGDEAVNVTALEQLLERVYTAGADGVYVCGSTGEGLILPAAERRKVTEVAVRNSPGNKQVIVHVGAWSFSEAQGLARHAASTGATAISSLPPANVSYSELLDYYRDLAAVGGIPFLAYYFPAAGGGSLSYDQLSEICALPGVAGLKFTDYDLYTLSLLVRDGHTLFNGRDEVLAAGLLMGANGAIGSIYNLVPGWFVELYAAAQAGRWAETQAIQARINDLIRVLLQFPLIPAIKRILTWNGVECGTALRPRAGLTPEQEASLLREMARFESLIPAHCVR